MDILKPIAATKVDGVKQFKLINNKLNQSMQIKDLNTEENSIPPNSRVPVGGSEYDTGLSVLLLIHLMYPKSHKKWLFTCT